MSVWLHNSGTGTRTHMCVSVYESPTPTSPECLCSFDQYGMPEEQRDQRRGKEREKEREIEGSIVNQWMPALGHDT